MSDSAFDVVRPHCAWGARAAGDVFNYGRQLVCSSNRYDWV